ncbi:hypothetical protein CISG_00158 [Coccidioides immitis RMSCC 3703]|uniref:Uncharacterized protein n=2 Tax=Coccidioides immitis TaxID=5501 RepID=A0A0J8QKW3_COCIT|nr:hypothetical protein CIRG_07379 [Coccidioides immitis RMSCC 2394]KMU71848.1 hypothetical protein CISG_00158 [Coccidioides immitis RMSCC 3703]
MGNLGYLAGKLSYGTSVGRSSVQRRPVFSRRQTLAVERIRWSAKPFFHPVTKNPFSLTARRDPKNGIIPGRELVWNAQNALTTRVDTSPRHRKGRGLGK